MKRVGILTSGGDAPGMNAAVRAVVRAGLYHDLEMFVIYDGYKGLVEGNIQQVDRDFVSDIVNRGGTIIRSARLPEFKEVETRQKGIEQLKKFGIDALVCIGGDGTYQGSKALSNMGINCIALPGTIDNDIASTDFTIGFDTALNTIVEAVDKLRDTSTSHQRCSIVEVMGRYCGDLALFSGIACGADLIVTSDYQLTRNEIIEKLGEMHKNGKRHAMVIITEKLCDVNELAHDIEKESGFECRAEVLGRIQRGGSPTARDRFLAGQMGVRAIELLLEGKGGRCVGLRGSELVDYDIDDALKMKRDTHTELVDVIHSIC